MKTRRGQRGYATILTILLVGMALTASTLGVMSTIRGTQDKTLSVHAATLAESRAWSGVELLRVYLGSQIGTLLTVALNGVIPITGIDGVSIDIVSMSGPDVTGNIRVVADVTGEGAGATATLRTVYDVSLYAGGSSGEIVTAPYSDLDVINIYNDLTMNGNITVVGNGNAKFVVDGNVTLTSASITGVDTIVSTGNVSINSAIAVKTVNANGNVSLSGSAALQSINAMGSVTLAGSASATTINSNGLVSFGGSSSATSVNSILGVSVTGGGASVQTINTDGSVTWTSSGSGKLINANSYVVYGGGNLSTTINAIGAVNLTGAGVSNVNTKSDTTLSYGSISNRLAGQGLLTVTGSGAVASGTVGGLIIKPLWNNSVNVNTQLGYQVDVAVVSVTPVEANQVTDRKVDAYALKDDANYVFEIDSAGHRQVTVRNVNGITDGVYYLGNYSGPYKDYLCTSLASDGSSCATPSTPQHTICEGSSDNNSCISYSAGEWSLNGTSLAPGVMWFAGDLNAGNGIYHDSFIASGDIRTSGSNKTVAVNYAGYAAVCLNQPTDTTPYTRFDGLYPNNFCDLSTQALTSNPLGNIAFLAGGYQLGVFSGGDIKLTASNDVYGSVIAGNELSTTGSTTIHGYITVAAQGADSLLTPTKWAGSTTLDLTNLPSSFVPGALPCMADCSTTSSGGTGAAVAVWTRYQ
ncbi:hypothetical protein [Solimonas marina]|uniref:Uncharacterized protein n=1 Tax=Solimonas marina TaxID=2714601 RepID=A0A969W7V7_9GAMM|nr:hypothetical protein [Solimonas marina]NKF21175.1 hypothetical protein [Solimonas marina]